MTARCGERITDPHKHEPSDQPGHPIGRYLGLSVGGAKSERTCLSVIDHYQKHQKAFVVDVFESIGAEGDLTADQVLLELIQELSSELPSELRGESVVRVMGVDAPLTLPPCLAGCDPACAGYSEKCRKPEVRWMRAQYLKARARKHKLKHFTPYSQRPVDVYYRCRHPEPNLMQDETMGANLAPQAARMSYLAPRVRGMNGLKGVELVEVWPKLSLYNVTKALRLTRRDVLEYRHVERGATVRARVLDRLADAARLFIYERDLKKFVHNTDAFDSLLCAWVAMMHDLGLTAKPKGDLPVESGWIALPEL